MSISLTDQARLAFDQPNFLDRVAAACFQGAVAALQATPNTDSVVQTKRVQLAHDIVNNVRSCQSAWAWVIVTRPSLTDESGLTDNFLLSQTTNLNLFDTVAQQVIA